MTTDVTNIENIDTIKSAFEKIGISYDVKKLEGYEYISVRSKYDDDIEFHFDKDGTFMYVI